MTLFLGLDGGGSGCRAVLADQSGKVLGRGQGGPCNIMSDREGAVAALNACIAATIGQHDPKQIRAVLGLAGANTSAASDWLPALLPFEHVRVFQDAVTAASGALGQRDGIVAAMGTGSVFIRQSGGQVSTLGGWGPVLGDEGSGNWLGRKFLAHVLRAHDGLAQITPLLTGTLERHGGPSGIVAFARRATAPDFAAEMPHLLAAQDDPAATLLLADAAETVVASIEKLREAEPLPVTFTGGLGPLYASLLAGTWQILLPMGGPLDGALALARDDRKIQSD